MREDAFKVQIDFPESPRHLSFDEDEGNTSAWSRQELTLRGDPRDIIIARSLTDKEPEVFIHGPPPHRLFMNAALIEKALFLIQRTPTDITLRPGLLASGYAPDDIDLHLEHLIEERLVSLYPTPNEPSFWRLKLRGRESRDERKLPPIGFSIS